MEEVLTTFCEFLMINFCFADVEVTRKRKEYYYQLLLKLLDGCLGGFPKLKVLDKLSEGAGVIKYLLERPQRGWICGWKVYSAVQILSSIPLSI